MAVLRRARPLLGTLVDIACEASDEAAGLDALGAAFDAVAVVHQALSFQQADSELSALNRAPLGQWVALGDDSVAVLAAALALSAETDGVFDACSAGPTGDWRGLELDAAGQRARRHAPLQVDASGIAKGHAVDRAVAVLVARGQPAGLVNAGGDLRVFGHWTQPLWVRDPADLAQARCLGELHQAAAATSASYLLDAPVLRHGRSRAPVAARASWTVQAPTCSVADMLTKLVAATGDTDHPALARHRARAWCLGADLALA